MLCDHLAVAAAAAAAACHSTAVLASSLPRLEAAAIAAELVVRLGAVASQ